MVLLANIFSVNQVYANSEKSRSNKKTTKEKTAQECRLYTDRINGQIKIVYDRYYELLLDRYNLHGRHNSIKNAHIDYGSYQGHIQMYNKQKGVLSTYITDARLANCGKYISKDAVTWSQKTAPSRPNEAEANKAGYYKK